MKSLLTDKEAQRKRSVSIVWSLILSLLILFPFQVVILLYILPTLMESNAFDLSGKATFNLTQIVVFLPMFSVFLVYFIKRENKKSTEDGAADSDLAIPAHKPIDSKFRKWSIWILLVAVLAWTLGLLRAPFIPEGNLFFLFIILLLVLSYISRPDKLAYVIFLLALLAMASTGSAIYYLLLTNPVTGELGGWNPAGKIFLVSQSLIVISALLSATAVILRRRTMSKSQVLQ